ncbi:septum formation initiator family protein [soil metagenome]
MKVIRILVYIVSSRYLLAITAFAIWITFFDESNLFVQRQRTKELNDLNKKIEYYKGQVDQTKQELNDLQNDPVILEKYAREKYFMKKDNEDIFVIDSSSLAENP